MDLSSINVLAELERIECDIQFAGEDELRVKCPFHDDSSPSCYINIEKKIFKCQTAGCEKSGDLLTFIAKTLNTVRQVVFVDLAKRYNLDDSPPINPKLVEKYHNEIYKAKPLLKELYARAINDEDIRRYRIGYCDGRIIIPITNEFGTIVNLRKYLPGAPGKDKFRNMRGRGKIRLFPTDQLEYDTILICGGELKAILAARLLNPRGIGAIATTGGEGNWDIDFSPLFRGKRTYVCFDVDYEGSKAADTVCARLKICVDWVGKAVLPIDADKYPHGDINDYVAKERATADDLYSLLQQTTEWEPGVLGTDKSGDTITDLHLSASVDAKYTGKRISVSALISAMDTSPYVIPRRVLVGCDRNQNNCAFCPIFATTPDSGGNCEQEIHPESRGIIAMIAAPQKDQQRALMDSLNIPVDCKSVEFSAKEYYNIEDVRLAPSIDISSRAVDHIVQPALCIGLGCELNESYSFTGRMYPHPKTQQSVLLISEYEATQDALSNFEVDYDELKVFQPKEWTIESLEEKLNEIYKELEFSVTRIFQRRDLHLALDLAYHSPLLINLEGHPVRGWTEILVLGDSSQGKSETTARLMEHYGLGEKMDCKNATVAGLLGGLQQLGSRWFVTWGIIPTHDQRLVVLEELKGADPAVISKLTDMRSSGIAEIPKIEKRRTHARTRLIALSNPRSDQPLSTYNYGIEAVQELIGGLEDIRRFDFTLLVSSCEISTSDLNKFQRMPKREAETVFTSDKCRKAVLWAWTRKCEQIQFDNYSGILDVSTSLCDDFTELIPIVDKGSMRYKVARLSAALAARTFSCEDNNLIVRNCHVEFIHKLLRRVYSSDVFGYLDFSKAIKSSNELVDPDGIRQKIRQTPFPTDFIKQMVGTNDIIQQDLQDWCGWDRNESMQLLSYLVRKHALKRTSRLIYRKTPAFIELLKHLKTKDRPEFIGESEF